jgi:hypothetical protein
MGYYLRAERQTACEKRGWGTKLAFDVIEASQATSLHGRLKPCFESVLCQTFMS